MIQTLLSDLTKKDAQILELKAMHKQEMEEFIGQMQTIRKQRSDILKLTAQIAALVKTLEFFANIKDGIFEETSEYEFRIVAREAIAKHKGMEG